MEMVVEAVIAAMAAVVVAVANNEDLYTLHITPRRELPFSQCQTDSSQPTRHQEPNRP